jgi:hypothetical protein
MEMKRRIKRYPAAHQLDEYSNENMQVRMLRLLGLLKQNFDSENTSLP